jgi:hypothetical protein
MEHVGMVEIMMETFNVPASLSGGVVELVIL